MNNFPEIPELDDLNRPIAATPAQLAHAVDRLIASVRRLKEINIEISQTAKALEEKVEKQELEIEALNTFKSEVKLGGKLAGWLATGTLALIGALATFFSGFGTKIFGNGH